MKITGTIIMEDINRNGFKEKILPVRSGGFFYILYPDVLLNEICNAFVADLLSIKR